MPRKQRKNNRSSKPVHSFELRVGSGEGFNIGKLFCAASKGGNRKMNDIKIIMALTILLLLAAFVLVSALRGDK
jgi:hypothetical protein